MAIRNARTATDELLKDGRFHYGAVLSDPETVDLASVVATDEHKLRAARNGTEDVELVEIVAFAKLIRADFNLDARLRMLELDVYKACKKNREAPAYQAAFPRGLTWLTSQKGAEASRAVKAVVGALHEHHPALHAEYATSLLDFAGNVVTAETEHSDAESATATASQKEVAARSGLVRTFYKNEGALLSIFPGERGKVRTFFRPTKRNKGTVTPKPKQPPTP